MTAALTTAAAVIALLANAQYLGLGAWLGSHGLGFADYAATRIVLFPRLDSLTSVGDTVILVATVTDRRGSALVGADILWRSENPAVATVDSAGTVVARGAGVTQITATIRKLVAAARVVVRQRVEGVAIGGDTLIRLPERQRVPLVASAVDARGQRVPDLVLAWTSSDNAVAAVDAEGTLTAGAPGRATLTATVGDHTAHAVVEVILAPARVVLEAGGAQRFPAGRKLPQPVTVRVLSGGGRPVPNTPVTFRLPDPDGVVNPSQAVTDGGGRARVTWTLSPRAGRQWLSVGAEGLDSVLTVGAEADPLPRRTKVEPAGPRLSGQVATRLDDPALIRVTDSSGVAVADVPVVWTVQDDGKIEPLADRTDSLGEARARWTLGPKAGQQRVRVQVGNPRTMPPLVFAATASPAPAAALRVAAGDRQQGSAGKPLPRPVVLVAADRFGNPVGGVAIRARPTDGSVGDSVLSTDSLGAVQVRWTLGRHAGAQRLQLRAAGVDSAAVVTARATALGAANLAFQNPPATAAPGRAVPITVVVTDAYGNPVSDAPITFTAAAGRLSLSRVMTDDAGRASTRWTPAATPAEQALAAVVRGTSVRTTQTVRVRR